MHALAGLTTEELYASLKVEFSVLPPASLPSRASFEQYWRALLTRWFYLENKAQASPLFGMSL